MDAVWHLEPPNDAHGALVAKARRVAQANDRRFRLDARYSRMYSEDADGTGEDRKTISQALKFNICASVVDTGKSHIGSKRPRPRFQTNDGDWSAVKKARGCEMVVDGEFRRSGFHKLAPMVFVDAAVSSIGGVKVFEVDGYPKIERVFPGEILVDERQGYYGEPRDIFQVKRISPDGLKAKLRDHKDYKRMAKAIDASTDSGLNADVFRFLENQGSIVEGETVLVVEGWHLPDLAEGKKNRGGRHVIAVDGATLLDEEWTRDTFPFAFYRWEKRQFGFYGRGMVEQIRAYQRGINYLDQKITDMLHIASRVWLAVPKGSGVNAYELNNDPATVLEVNSIGEAPRVMSQNAVPSELFQRRRQLIEDAFRETGISEMQATGSKPSGLDSGEAIREFRDTISQRFTDKMNAWDEFHLVVAKVVIEEKSAIAERCDDRPVQIKRRKGMGWAVETIGWKDFDFGDDQYVLEVTPSSLLPDSSSGRVQTATDWFSAGIINGVEFKALLDVPDLDRFKSLDLATYEIVLENIEGIVDDGEYTYPEPTDDLEMTVKLVTQSLAKYRIRKLPEDRLDLLRNYLADAQGLQQDAIDKQQPQAQPAQPGAQPLEAPAGAEAPAAVAGPSPALEAVG